MVGAAATVHPARVKVKAKEEARVRVAVLPAHVSAAEADDAVANQPTRVRVRAGAAKTIAFDRAAVPAGAYVVAVRLEAVVNPSRTRLFLRRFGGTRQ